MRFWNRRNNATASVLLLETVNCFLGSDRFYLLGAFLQLQCTFMQLLQEISHGSLHLQSAIAAKLSTLWKSKRGTKTTFCCQPASVRTLMNVETFKHLNRRLL